MGGDTVTKVGLSVHLRVDHTSMTSHAYGVGSQNVGLRDFCQFDIVEAGGICVSQTRLV